MKASFKSLIIAITLFVIFFLGNYTFLGGGFLVDSIGFHFVTPLEKQFQDPNIYSRPLAGFLKTWLSYLSFNRYLLIAVLSIINFLAYLIFYFVLKKIGVDRLQALLVTFLSFICIYSTSIMFSPVMVVSTVPVTLLFLAVYFIHNKNIVGYCIGGVILFITTLIYEVNIFLLPILIFIFYSKKAGVKDILYRTLFVFILPMFFMFLYKNYLGYYIFEGYGQYTDGKVVISLRNILDTFISLFKTYILDTLFIVKRGVIGIQHYQVFDFILLCLILFITFIIASIPKNKFPKIPLSYILLFILVFILSHGIFFVSTYKANAYGFENRVLGLARFSWAILFFSIFSTLIYSKFGTVFRGIFSITVLLFGITLISQKNAWVFADNYNNKIIKSFREHYPKQLESRYFIISYDKSKVLNNFVNDEPTLKADYEFMGLLRAQGFKNNESIVIYGYRPKGYAIDRLFSKEFNKRFASEVKIKEEYPSQRKVVDYPFYFFDYDKQSLTLVKTKEELNEITTQ